MGEKRQIPDSEELVNQERDLGCNKEQIAFICAKRIVICESHISVATSGAPERTKKGVVNL